MVDGWWWILDCGCFMKQVFFVRIILVDCEWWIFGGGFWIVDVE